MLASVVDALRRDGQGPAMRDKMILELFTGLIVTMIVGTICALILHVAQVI